MSYELTIAMNLRTKAVTQYTGYEFNSCAVVGERLFGASKNGVKILSGENSTDEGSTIDWSVSAGFHDFVSTHRKRLYRLYAGIQTDGTILATVETENGTKKSYPMQARELTTRSPVPHIATINRTHNGRFFKITLENSGRAFASIESLDAIFHILNTRI